MDVSNYRLVSVLSTVSKLLERAVHIQVNNHCNESNLLYPLQSGFRNNYSTNTCLIHLHDFIRSELSNGNYVGLVMLDVQKAFDSVDHELLCQKIHLAGIESDWFRSYLTNRKQTVCVNGVLSSQQTIQCGVPQGSILGPWCYLIFCNDMPSCVKCKMILYADDTILLVSHRDLDKLSTTLSSELAKCFHWLVNNRLSMHKGKTEALIMSTKRKRHNTKEFKIHHDDHIIKPTQTAKYLGLTINSHLSGDEIVKSVVGKAMSRLKFLYRHRNVLTTNIRTLLVKALILCHFDYAIVAWHPSLTAKLKKSLQTAQNKIVRYLLDLGPRVHIGQNELDRVGLLCVEDRARQLMLSSMFDIFKGTAPQYLKQNFQIRPNPYSTRSNDKDFITHRCKGDAEHNFSSIGAIEWNKLPYNVKSIKHKLSFKKAVKIYLKTQAHARESRLYSHQ